MFLIFKEHNFLIGCVSTEPVTVITGLDVFAKGSATGIVFIKRPKIG